jgi:hypothetical protein
MAKSSVIKQAAGSIHWKDTAVSDRATAYSIPPQSASASTGNELAVRPKVLRRPAHFSARPLIEAPTPALIPLQHTYTEQKLTPAFRAWQDDGKFAITLLALVIVVNLVVSAWLSAISPSPAAVKSTLIDTTPATVHVLDSHPRAISEQ